MKALVLSSLSGPEALSVKEFADPDPKPGQTLVRVRAGGLNFADVMTTKGGYPGTPPPPMIVGREFSGVEENSGRRVMGYAQWAAFAERTPAYSNMLWPVPDHWSDEDAAVLARFRQGHSVRHCDRSPAETRCASAVREIGQRAGIVADLFISKAGDHGPCLGAAFGVDQGTEADAANRPGVSFRARGGSVQTSGAGEELRQSNPEGRSLDLPGPGTIRELPTSRQGGETWGTPFFSVQFPLARRAGSNTQASLTRKFATEHSAMATALARR